MSMSSAFGISDLDVENVLLSNGVNPSDLDVDELMSKLDLDAVAKAALDTDFNLSDTDEEILNNQTESAYEEIKKQLQKLNVI